MSNLPKYLSPKTEDVNVKIFNVLTDKIETKAMTDHIFCNFKCNFNNTTFNSNEKWNNKTSKWKGKNYRTWKEHYSWNPNTCIYKNNKYLKRFVDTSVIDFDEMIIVKKHNGKKAKGYYI